MQSLLTTVYKDDDLCNNIANWFTDLSNNIRIAGVRPNIYVAQPLDFKGFKVPAIFIFPEKFTKSDFTIGSDVRTTTINIVLHMEYAYKTLMTKLMRWVHDVSYLLDGNFAFEGTATAGSNTTLTDSGLAKLYADDLFNTIFKIIITGGTGDGLEATVTDYNGTTGQFSFADIGADLDETSEYCLQKLEPRWIEDSYSKGWSISSGDYIVNSKKDNRTAVGGSIITFKIQIQE